MLNLWRTNLQITVAPQPGLRDVCMVNKYVHWGVDAIGSDDVSNTLMRMACVLRNPINQYIPYLSALSVLVELRQFACLPRLYLAQYSL